MRPNTSIGYGVSLCRDGSTTGVQYMLAASGESTGMCSKKKKKKKNT